MKFGLHSQLPQSPHQSDVALYRDSLDQAAHAETLGFESVWPVEQHFNAAFSLLPSPLLWLAALVAYEDCEEAPSDQTTCGDAGAAYTALPALIR